MAPFLTMETSFVQGHFHSLIDSVISTTGRRIIQTAVQAQLRCLQRFFSFFKPHICKPLYFMFPDTSRERIYCSPERVDTFESEWLRRSTHTYNEPLAEALF